jgi:hypothetical protein
MMVTAKPFMICKKPTRSAAWLCLASVFACGGDETRTTVLENTGAICLTQVGSQITVNADFGVCLGCGSHASPAPSCEASFDSASISVSSRANIITDTSFEGDCPDACFLARAACPLTVPAEGEVSVVFGAQQATVRLPLASATPLFQADPVEACP